jgi:hypothetical protein
MQVVTFKFEKGGASMLPFLLRHANAGSTGNIASSLNRPYDLHPTVSREWKRAQKEKIYGQTSG